MYPWYRDSVSQLGQFCGNPMPTTIKTENGYNDCMLALDYAAQSKVSQWPVTCIAVSYFFSVLTMCDSA